MTLLQHAYAVRDLYTRGAASKDTQIPLSLIVHYLDVVRAKLTEEKADKYRNITEHSFQSLCVPLEKGHLHNCCDAPNAGCTLLKSKDKLPKYLNTRWGDFSKVTTLAGENISRTSVTANKLAKYTLTNKTPKPGWFIHDQHLFVINNTTLELVLFNSLFNEPTAVESANCTNDPTSTTCPDIYSTEYPIDPDLVEPAYKKVLELLAISVRFPPKDQENNAKDDQVSS